MQIKPTSLKEIASIIKSKYIGADDHMITGFNEIHRVSKGDVVFVDHPKYYEKALSSSATTIIINKEIDCPKGKALIIHDEPFTAFNQLTLHFQPKSYSKENISKTVQIGKNPTIMPGVFIGNNVSVGDNVILHPNVIIYDNCVIGNNVHIHAGTVIGSDSFYFKDRKTSFEQLNCCGNVIIQDHVVIGANCTIDRGVTESTIIGKHSILDNLIHIGHDVHIGEMCLFAAQVGIAGCTTIGNNVKVWGQVGIASNSNIPDNVVLYAQSGVTGDLENGKTYFGSPAGEAKEKMKEIFALKQLPDLIKKLY
jgi:UDP-3-O-[3-hydroxymyristoyl] glucosamine N-acyltransferase